MEGSQMAAGDTTDYSSAKDRDAPDGSRQSSDHYRLEQENKRFENGGSC